LPFSDRIVSSTRSDQRARQVVPGLAWMAAACTP
jgi:hypothetical protein